MSYPPPPGLSSASPQPPSSLPPRPPAPTGGPSALKPAFSSAPPSSNGAPGTGSAAGYGGFTAFRPRSVASTNPAFRTSNPIVSAPPQPPSGYTPQPTNYSGGSYPSSAYPQQQQQAYYTPTTQDPYNVVSPPQIVNPFPLPGQERSAGPGRGRADYDPELEAQIAQWQSAYAGKEGADASSRSTARTRISAEGAASASGANAGPVGGRADAAAASETYTTPGVAAVVSGADGKQKTVVRSGGGQTWTDTSLLEWDPAHFRLFVGNLAGEVTDDSLLKAFARYPSVQKARVIRDKRTTKSKGYGFVSFSDGDEYFQAAREMQGKYIGSHPVLLRRSTTEIRPSAPGNKQGGKHGKGGGYGGGKSGGSKTGAGIQKKSSKTKGGLRVLG